MKNIFNSCDKEFSLDENEDINYVVDKNEIYSVDYSPSLRYFIYAGNDQKCTVYDTNTKSVCTVIEGFTDSVIFCRFLNTGNLLVCTIDGNILITSLDGSISHSEDISEEISCVEVSDESIFIGTYAGTVYKFNYDLSDQTVYMEQGSEIYKIHHYNGIIYSLSESTLASTDGIRIQLEKATSFSMIPGTEIFCISTLEDVLVYKSTTLLNKFSIEGHTETVEYTDGYFIIAGYCDYILLINTKINMCTHKMCIPSSGINKLKKGGDHKIYFSTMCGYVGVCDIRRDESVHMYETRVEAPFDIYWDKDTFYVGGLKGIDILKTEDFN
ncbi:hypothetical protein P3W45_001368 [Vairimorpha bombi]|jgi:hypothetical protein